MIFGWFVLQVISGMYMEQGVAGVAFYAHIGGFLAGLALLSFIRHEAYTDPQTNTQVSNVPFLSVTGVICLIMLFVYLSNPSSHHGSPAASADAAPGVKQPEKAPAAGPSLYSDHHDAPVKTAHPSAQSHHHGPANHLSRHSSQKHNASDKHHKSKP